MLKTLVSSGALNINEMFERSSPHVVFGNFILGSLAVCHSVGLYPTKTTSPHSFSSTELPMDITSWSGLKQSRLISTVRIVSPHPLFRKRCNLQSSSWIQLMTPLTAFHSSWYWSICGIIVSTCQGLFERSSSCTLSPTAEECVLCVFVFY